MRDYKEAYQTLDGIADYQKGAELEFTIALKISNCMFTKYERP